MSVINQVTGPAAGADVFSPLIYEFAFSSSSASFVSVEAIAAIDVAAAYSTLLEVGDSVRITNGAYLGVYTIIEITEPSPGVTLRLLLNTPFIGSSAATGSSRFTPEGLADFQILAGYSTGDEAALKPWQIIDEVRVSPNTSGIYRFDVSGFLRSRFAITAPVAGPNVPISLRYSVRLKSATAIPDDAAALTLYYGLEDLTPQQQAGEEAVGERPILFFGNVPTLYSLALGKGIINNFIADPEAPGSTTGGAVIDLQLLSCQPNLTTWLGLAPTAGFTVAPALPSWIAATADGNNINLVINPCTAGAGDYLSADYNPLDYLAAGEVNSVTGCFSFVFSNGGELFTLNVCVTPVSELVDVCAADSLIFGWLNQRGGFSSFALETKFTKGREFGGESTVVSSTEILKRVEFSDVYDVYELRGGVLSKVQLDMLASLRTSIQVYLYNTATQAFDIPIVLDRQNFSTYGNRFNQSETRYSLRFKLAKRVIVQTQ
jgi:hypothetical protein